MQQKHNPVAYFELGDISLLDHELQHIGLERPYSVGILERMLGDDLAIEFIKFYKVRPAENEFPK